MSYQAPPGFRDELIEGEIVLSPEPKPLHADVAKQLEAILTAAVQGTSFIVRQRINFLLPRRGKHAVTRSLRHGQTALE
jgi:hypothetical protein